MRCPKCHYLSFDPEPRCKNCGYDLEVADADLALHTSEPAEEDEALPDLTLHERPSAAAPVTLELVQSAAKSRAAVMDHEEDDDRDADVIPRLTLVEEPVEDDYEEPVRQLEREPIAPFVRLEPLAIAEEQIEETEEIESIEEIDQIDQVEQIEGTEDDENEVPAVAAMSLVPEPVREPFRSAHTTELPLFVKGISDSDLRPSSIPLSLEEEPIVPPTRPPLGVRRGSSEPSLRAQATRVPERRLGPLDHDLLEDLKRVEREEAARDRGLSAFPDEAMDAGFEDRVEPGRRLAAAAIDVGVLGGIAVFVFWATLRLCNVSVGDVGWAALLPFLAFVAVMDLSYLLMFTAAGGQTVGKMLMHLRVVGDDREADEPVPMGRAAWRAALTMVSVIVFGLGWLPALFGSGLALHDRLAHTRVVRA